MESKFFKLSISIDFRYFSSFFIIFRDDSDLQNISSFAPVETQNVCKKYAWKFTGSFEKINIFLKLVVFRTGFDENSSEFQYLSKFVQNVTNFRDLINFKF